MAKDTKTKTKTEKVKGVKVNLKELEINDVEIHPENARKGNHKKIRRSIIKHGFIDPIVVQKSTMRVLGGNNRVFVAMDLGITSVPAQVIDVDDHEAYEIMLVLNKTADEAGYDEKKQLKIISKVIGDSEDLEEALAGTGYDKSEVTSMQIRQEWQDDKEIEKVKKGKSKKETPATKTERRESLEERKKAIEDLGMRQIVLSIPVKTFKVFQEGLKTARSEHGVKSNEDLMVSMMIGEGFLPKDFVLIEKPKKDSKKK